MFCDLSCCHDLITLVNAQQDSLVTVSVWCVYCLQLVAVALAAMLFQLDSVRRVCRQRMACFSVFLALPSATLRSMATAPCQVHRSDGSHAPAYSRQTRSIHRVC